MLSNQLACGVIQITIGIAIAIPIPIPITDVII